MSLHSPGQPAFAVASLSAPLLRGALHTPLTREQTLAVLDALNGEPGTQEGGLELKAHIEYRARRARRRLLAQPESRRVVGQAQGGCR